MQDNRHLALIGCILYVGVVKFSSVREIVLTAMVVERRRALVVLVSGGVKGALEWDSGNAISNTFEDWERGKLNHLA